ncbi:MAG: flavocytochrome c [Eubacteriales bacterium]|nr:flavocytochrome c [Eubacteriales bacterium]
MRKSNYVLAAGVLAVSLTACSKPAAPETTAAETTAAETTAAETTAAETAGIADGTYTGEGTGKGGKIVVEVTFKDSKIEAIKVLENAETPGFAEAMDTLTEAMITANQVDVDGVSGATLTSNGFTEAVKDALAKSGGTAEQLAATGVTAEKEAREDSYTADVVVVGAGGAGLSAAVTAAEAGAKVIVVEKMMMPGGNTLISGGEMAAPGNWLQAEQGVEDSVDQFYNDILKGGDNENDPELVRVLAENALPAAEWLKDDIQMTFEDYMLFFGGHSVERSLVPLNATGVEMIEKLTAKAESLGVEIHTNTPAKELVQTDGKVTAVKAEYDGKEITYNANKGVILATGGFGSNLEMRIANNPDMNEKILSTNTVGSTGDGITMAEALGAQTVDMQYIQTYPTCDPETGTLLYVGDVRLEGRSILVNLEGKRFVEELERRDVISMAVTQQTGGVSYMFWDEASMEASKVNVKHEKEYNNLIERGILVKADTVEEAAAHFGIDAAELQKTIDKYNEYCEKGKDEEFNKRGELVAFTDGPYYIMKSTPAIHHTMGGLKINTDAQVLTTENEVIPGLYAAGEVTGDIHGTNRLGSDAIADIVVFGRIAGKNAAEGK